VAVTLAFLANFELLVVTRGKVEEESSSSPPHRRDTR
jgi:hypothetical protein